MDTEDSYLGGSTLGVPLFLTVYHKLTENRVFPIFWDWGGLFPPSPVSRV